MNTRGEVIDNRANLLSDPERGQTWIHWAGKYLPRELFEDAGLMGGKHPETGEWFNVVEHTIKVAGTSLALAEMLRERGVQVDVRATVRAAMVHDLTKRGAVAKGMTREQEDKSQLLPAILKEHGYSELEIGAASNTGRLPDRYIKDPAERRAAIQARGVEAAIVGLTDALMRGTDLLSLETARDKNIVAKPDPKSAEFFANNWYPYYRDVIGYLEGQAPGLKIGAQFD